MKYIWPGVVLRSITVMLALVVGLPVANAQTVEAISLPAPARPVRPVDSFVGAAAHDVMFDVPSFHQIAPTLGVSYRSSRGNGWLGTGAALTGLSAIELKSAGLGAPRGNATDVFVLDGETLLPCTVSITAPSCTTGGTHVLRHDRDIRIVKSGASWLVTSPTGVTSTYTAVTSQVWAITERRDPFGNQVTFTYTASGAAYYPATISYNGTVVTFAWQTRPDIVTEGVGTALRSVTSRLASVTVVTDGAMLRSYKLTYTPTTVSGLSQLTSVQEFGTDALTSLPATHLDFFPEPANGGGFNGGQGFFAGAIATFSSTSAPTANYTEVRVGDINGDGRSDAIAIAKNGFNTSTGTFDVSVRLGTASGAFGSSVRTTASDLNAGAYQHVETGDVDGDGRTDLVFIRRATTTTTGFIDLRVAIGQTNGTFVFRPATRISSSALSYDYEYAFVTDMDHDGKADVVLGRIAKLGGGRYGQVMSLVSKSTGTGFATSVSQQLTNLDDGTAWSTVSMHAGDIDGDRLTDLVVVVRHSSLCHFAGEADRAESHSMLGRGDSTFLAPVTTHLNPPTGGPFGSANCDDWFLGETLADVNGDGRADLVGDSASTISGGACTDCDSDLDIAVNLSTGNGSFMAPQNSLGWSGSGVGIGRYRATFADVNGDGMADRVGTRLVNGTPFIQINISRGNGTFFSASNPVGVTSGAPTWWNDTSGVALIADVDGDGRAEPLLSLVNTTTWLVTDVRPTAPFGPLLQSVTLPSGGSISYALKSSAESANTYMPFVVPVVASETRNDGRGGVATTNYDYASGLYVPSERRFLGFKLVQTTDPTGLFRLETFTQHVADLDGTLESVRAWNTAGIVVRNTTSLFIRSGNGTTAPYVSRPSERYVYDCTSASCKSTRRAWTYSSYGAVASDIEYGDTSVTGDERTTYHSQVPNTAAFLTQLDSEVTVRAGANVPTGARLAQTRISYDAAASHTTAPIRGAATATSRWISGSNFATSAASFDVNGNRLTETTPLGFVTGTTYDARQRPSVVTNPLGHTFASSYDTVGRLVQTVDANGGVTDLAYDVLSRLVSRTTPDGGVTTLAFVNWGTPTNQYVESVVADGTATGLWRRTFVDGFGRTVRTLDKGGINVATQYDARGFVAQTSAPYLTGDAPQWTTNTYDELGRITHVETPDGAGTDTVYTHWLVATTDALGRRTDRLYDGFGQLVQTTEYKGAATYVTTIARDLLGRDVGITDASGNLTTHTFDGLGRKTQSNDPDRGLWRYTFDVDGRITRQVDARNVALDMTYDALGRVLSRQRGATVTATFEYDRVAAASANVGRLTDFTDASGETHREYDPAGRLRSERKVILGNTYKLDWDYDQAGRLSATTYPTVGGTRESVATTYDTSGRVSQVGTYLTGATYDARAALIAASYGNGNLLTRGYSLTRGWMMTQSLSSSTGTVIDDFTLTRNLLGEVKTRSSISWANDRWDYGYDGLGRLVTINNPRVATYSESYSYDPLGNPTSITRASGTSVQVFPAAGAPHPHAPVSIDGVTVRYDANGNRLGVGAGTDATFDFENRMSEDGTTTYLYDAEGTRVAAGNTVFVRNLYERTGSSSLRFYYLGQERIARRDEAGVVNYYHADNLGSMRRLTAADGTPSARKLVSAFGTVLTETGVADPFGLAGQRLDASGNYHMGARYMDPNVAQFTTPDPSDAPDAARPQTLNRYSYANNNPLQFKDPTGFESILEDGKQVDMGDAKPPADSVLRERAQQEPSQWLQVPTKDGNLVDRPRLFSPAYERENPHVFTTRGGLWAHRSVTGEVFSDLRRSEAPPSSLTPYKFDGRTREGLIAQLKVLDGQGLLTRDAFYLEGAGSGRFELFTDDQVREVNPRGPLLPGVVWIYPDDFIGY